MYNAAEVDALRERLEREGVGKPERVTALAWAAFGWPYVFGSWGVLCTPEERRKRAGYHPEYKAKIFGACPALSDKQTTCEGCEWDGCLCFDCRGFTAWLLEQVGLNLYGDGATTQYDTDSNWAVKGPIEEMPPGLVACVFKRRNGVMSHTGLHVGGGEIVHCSTTVKAGTLSDSPPWTHFGVPAGLYSDEELKKAGVNVDKNKNMPTIRKGATGELVIALQKLLIGFGYGGYLSEKNPADGIFGGKTEETVKAFQRDNGLKADGIVGPKTWAALGYNPMDGQPETPQEPDEQPDEPADGPALHDMVSIPRSELVIWANVLDETAREIREFLGKGG